MKTFAFLFYPLNFKQLRKFWPWINFIPPFIYPYLSKNILPFKISKIKKVRSSQGDEIQGFIMACPLLPQDLLTLKKEFVLDKIITAGRIAKHYGADILGLAGCDFIIKDKIYNASKAVKLPFTNGNALTAWSVFEAIYRVSKSKKMELKNFNLGVIGIDNPVALLSLGKLADYVQRIIITDKNQQNLENVKDKICNLNQTQILIEEDITKVARESDVLIIADDLADTKVSIEDFKPNSIICDISLSKTLRQRMHPRLDVTLINPGLIKLPYPVDFGIDDGFPKDIISASLAEAMLLTFKGRFVNYSLGDSMNLDKLEEIADIAARYGFEVWVPQAPVR